MKVRTNKQVKPKNKFKLKRRERSRKEVKNWRKLKKKLVMRREKTDYTRGRRFSRNEN